MTAVMTTIMGDPVARHSAIRDVIEGRALARQEEDRQIAEVREAFRQEKKSGPKGPIGPRKKATASHASPRPWIKPSLLHRGVPMVSIEQSGELRLRSVIRRELSSGKTLHVRVAAETGNLWIEACQPDDPFARRVGANGDVQGGSLRHELAAAGFTTSRSYSVTREPDGCWVAHVDDGSEQGKGKIDG